MIQLSIHFWFQQYLFFSRISTKLQGTIFQIFKEKFLFGISQSPKKEIPIIPLESDPETLGTRLYKARKELGQTPSGISLLLDISEDYYLKLESGSIPEPELLKRIAALFQWNYNELRLLLQNENIHQFQPRVTEIKSTSGFPISQVKTLLEEIQKCWTGMESEKQELLLVQLEVIRDTAKRWQSS